MIESYRFGRMVISGKEYSSDLIVFPNGRIVDSWWRKHGHSLAFSDIRNLIEAGPEILIVGTGASGLMKPVTALQQELNKLGINMVARPTAEAVKEFNRRNVSEKVGACFHLTC